METYIDFERNKFNPDPCATLLSPDDQATIQELSLRLTASDEVHVEAMVQQEWNAYDASMDAMVKKIGNTECIKASWMVQNYGKLLQRYVNETKDVISTPPSLSSKRSSAAVALDSCPSPVKSAKKLPPAALASSCAPAMKVNETPKNITSVEDLGKKLATTYSVVGKFLVR